VEQLFRSHQPDRRQRRPGGLPQPRPDLQRLAGSARTTVDVNRGALYDLREQFGLNSAEVTALFNYSGSAEKFVKSSNGSNSSPSSGGFFLLMPDGTLRAWNGISAASSAIVGTPGVDVYANPSLLTTAQPTFIGDSINNLKVQFGLDTAENANLSFLGGKFLHSSNGSNNSVAGGGLYVLSPDGNLRQWNGVSVLSSPVVGTPGVAVYANPALLYASTGRVAAVGGAVDNTGNLTLTPNVAFVGNTRVLVTAFDGALSATQGFLFTATDTAPTASPSPTTFSAGTNPTGGTANLNSFDAESDTLQYSTPVVSGYDALYDLKVKYGLNTPELTGLFSHSGHQEKFLQSSNESNAAIPSHGGLYVIVFNPGTSNYELREWNGSDALAGNFVANVGQSVYNNPSLLFNATQPAAPSGVSVNRVGDSLNLVWPNGFTGTFRVSLTIGDGAFEIVQSFLVTVTP
jgi:hypothetical protein